MTSRMVNAFPNPRSPKSTLLPKKGKVWKPAGPFPFFNLPLELRIHVYHCTLVADGVIDLHPKNYKSIAPRLKLLMTCRKVHDEAYPVFYGRHTFRLFPVYYEYLDDRRNMIPIIAQLPPQYRSVLTCLELRLGPGWGNPPRCWSLGSKTGIKDCTSLRTLKIFVEVDPSHPVFRGFSISTNFYTDFCGQLVAGMLRQAPSIEKVELDAYPSVTRDSELMKEVIGHIISAQKRIVWGPSRHWDLEELIYDQGAVQVPSPEVAVLNPRLSLVFEQMTVHGVAA